MKHVQEFGCIACFEISSKWIPCER
ncbi:hypothetical protein K6750_17080 [Vibrio alginolyticus]|nr:hypothetical protein K6750_17080 [Vibrio alginolyticus]